MSKVHFDKSFWWMATDQIDGAIQIIGGKYE